MTVETKNLYKSWNESLTNAMITKIINAALGGNFTIPTRELKIKRSAQVILVYVGTRESNDKMILSANEHDGPYFIINDTLRILFDKGEYASQAPFVKAPEVQKIENNIDWFSAYTCMSKIFANQE